MISEKPKFETQTPKPKLEEKESEIDPALVDKGGVQTLEGEGGAAKTEVDTGEGLPVEVPETVIEEPRVERSWREILLQAKEEFPEEIQRIIEKSSQGEKLKQEEYHRLDHFAQLWFREVLGIKIRKKISFQESVKKEPKKPKKPLTEEELAEQKRKHEEILGLAQERNKQWAEQRQTKLAELASQKINKMEQLHGALRNLDRGEPVEEFRDETRRVVYFDEESQQYFAEEDGSRKILGIGDIVSDYAWGIKYIPDGDLVELAYRIIAKKKY